MADIEHKNITDPNIHEPKGITGAADGEVYIADGAGSGSWSPLPKIYISGSVTVTSGIPRSFAICSPINGTITRILTAHAGNLSPDTITLAVNSNAMTPSTITPSFGATTATTITGGNSVSNGSYITLSMGSRVGSGVCNMTYIIELELS